MNTRFTLLAYLSLCLGAAVWAQPIPSDPFADNLFPPELVLQQQRAIALTAEQREFIESTTDKTQPEVQEAERRVREEVQKLGPLIDKDLVDEKAVLAQADRVTSAERELRKRQLGLLVSIKNKLTPEQQQKLKGLKTRLLVLHAKGDQVGVAVRHWQEQGRDPSVVAPVMQEADSLIRAGKLTEAEAALNRALKLLADAPAN